MNNFQKWLSNRASIIENIDKIIDTHKTNPGIVNEHIVHIFENGLIQDKQHAYLLQEISVKLKDDRQLNNIHLNVSKDIYSPHFSTIERMLDDINNKNPLPHSSLSSPSNTIFDKNDLSDLFFPLMQDSSTSPIDDDTNFMRSHYSNPIVFTQENLLPMIFFGIDSILPTATESEYSIAHDIEEEIVSSAIAKLLYSHQPASNHNTMKYMDRNSILKHINELSSASNIVTGHLKSIPGTKISSENGIVLLSKKNISQLIFSKKASYITIAKHLCYEHEDPYAPDLSKEYKIMAKQDKYFDIADHDRNEITFCKGFVEQYCDGNDTYSNFNDHIDKYIGGIDNIFGLE